MRSYIILVIAFFSLSSLAQVNQVLPSKQLAYYGAEFYQKKPSKELLFKILNGIHTTTPGQFDQIGDCHGDCYRHTSVGYDGARKILFGELFVVKDQRGYFVEDVYCGKKFHFRDVSEVSHMHTEVNIEHTWPQSKFNRHFEKNMQKSDMHHLFPTDSDANNRRANHPFAEAEGRPDELNVDNCDLSQLIDSNGSFRFAPPVSHRGNVARALFYFATRYNLTIGTAEEMFLRRWHQQDPVDEAEFKRHEIIVRYQKVRNPFVDFPQLVEKISDF